MHVDDGQYMCEHNNYIAISLHLFDFSIMAMLSFRSGLNPMTRKSTLFSWNGRTET